ncbi:hypothetical protein L0222_31455 [bacterium]|nr:hypothetical protein [bacterium]MCI0606057.1 hypothetical protein [bacterium]
MPDSKTITFTLTILVFLTLLGASILYAQPDETWNQANTGNTQNVVDDCDGAASQTNTAEVLPCQSYAADIYESLNPAGNGFQDADIAFYRVGADADFFYFEFEMVGSWNYDNTGESRRFAIEIDVDRVTEAGPRWDYGFLYDPALGHLNQGPPTWINTGGNGDGKTKGFRDSNNDVGGLGGTCSALISDQEKVASVMDMMLTIIRTTAFFRES